MENGREMICDRCRKAVPFSDIKYMNKSDGSITSRCSACRNKNKIEIKKESEKKEAMKKTYRCSRCNYKFNFNTGGSATLRCPYCGKADKVSEYKVVSADELIKNSEF